MSESTMGQVKTDDSISRQAAIEMLNENELARQADDVFDGDLHRYKRAAQRIIAQLPTIEPKNIVEDYCRSRNLVVVAAEDFHRFDEPKRGKWIYDKGLYRCTACNNLLTVAGWDIPEEQIYKSFKFCPNCGAKMDVNEQKSYADWELRRE